MLRLSRTSLRPASSMPSAGGRTPGRLFGSKPIARRDFAGLRANVKRRQAYLAHPRREPRRLPQPSTCGGAPLHRLRRSPSPAGAGEEFRARSSPSRSATDEAAPLRLDVGTRRGISSPAFAGEGDRRRRWRGRGQHRAALAAAASAEGPLLASVRSKPSAARRGRRWCKLPAMRPGAPNGRPPPLTPAPVSARHSSPR
jgi:hypothetical protein